MISSSFATSSVVANLLAVPQCSSNVGTVAGWIFEEKWIADYVRADLAMSFSRPSRP
jgi:hypothetical protein